MKNSIPYLYTICFIALTLLSGCEKFDRGGLRSKGDHRLTSKTWEMEKCELIVFDTMYYTLENNFINHFTIFNWDPNYNKYIEITDVTDDIFIQDLSLNFNQSGILEINYFNNNSAVNQGGSWEWAGPEMKPGVVSGEIFTEGINTIPLKDSLEFNPYFIHVEKLRPNKLEIRIRTIPEVNYNLERFIETYRFTFKGN